MTPPDQPLRPAVARVQLQAFKSIASCDVGLQPLTMLVGPNGSGKSNFLDALRFVSDALNTTLDQAVRDRSGINDVRRRSSGRPNTLLVRLGLNLPAGSTATYAFEIGAVKGSGFKVQREQCAVIDGESIHGFERKGTTITGIEHPPRVSADRLALVTLSGYPQFRPVFDLLSGMAFYNLSPGVIREHQPPDAGDVLLRDGRNLASVIGRLENEAPDTKQRLEAYIARLVPGLDGVSRKSYGARETLEFRQSVKGAKHPWHFSAASMSDGTLRALGILAALFQSAVQTNGDRRVTLVGIEEPEVALHPAGAGLLLDALHEASRHVQVVVTTHSPDLLDSPDVAPDSILAVRADQGTTEIGPVDEAGRETVRRGLYTAGELLRSDQLMPRGEGGGEVPKDDQQHLNLFES